jgi:hypothetical protein
MPRLMMNEMTSDDHGDLQTNEDMGAGLQTLWFRMLCIFPSSQRRKGESRDDTGG